MTKGGKGGHHIFQIEQRTSKNSRNMAENFDSLSPTKCLWKEQGKVSPTRYIK
jgi:hypothetical protein